MAGDPWESVLSSPSPRTTPPLGTPAPTRRSGAGSPLSQPRPSPSSAPGGPAPSIPPATLFLSPGFLSQPLSHPGPSPGRMLSPPLLAPPISPQSCLGALALAPLHPLLCPRPFSSSSAAFYPRPLVAPSPSIPALLRARRSVPVPPDAPSSLSSLQSARFLPPPPFPPSLSSHFHSVPAGPPISTPQLPWFWLWAPQLRP